MAEVRKERGRRGMCEGGVKAKRYLREGLGGLGRGGVEGIGSEMWIAVGLEVVLASGQGLERDLGVVILVIFERWKCVEFWGLDMCCLVLKAAKDSP